MTPLADSLAYVDEVCALAGPADDGSAESEGDERKEPAVHAPAAWAEFADSACTA